MIEPTLLSTRRMGSPPPGPPMAVLVMLAEEDDDVVLIDLSTHPCGQHILDDYAAGAQLVPADHLRAQGLGTQGLDGRR